MAQAAARNRTRKMEAIVLRWNPTNASDEKNWELFRSRKLRIWALAIVGMRRKQGVGQSWMS